MRSEWTKLRSLRSTVWSLLAALGFILLFSVLIPSLMVSQWSHRPGDEPFDATNVSLAGVGIGQLAIGVLGVLLISGEYSTGMIRASIAAVPARVPILVAKAIVFAVTVFFTTLPVLFAAFFIGQAIFGKEHDAASLSDPGVLRVVFGSALYLTSVGLLGLALGALLRHTAGAISLLVGLLIVLPPLMLLLPESIRNSFPKYLPGHAADSLTTVHRMAHTLPPWTGFGVFCAYWVVGLVAAAWLLKRRDA
jgi:ABC-type transport system involved in multi-copper enzyme maturation permease subunit